MNNDFNDIKDSSNLSFDKVWSNIKPALDAEGKRREKRKRRFIIFWWFTAFVIGGGLLFVCNKELGIGNNELANELQNLPVNLPGSKLELALIVKAFSMEAFLEFLLDLIDRRAQSIQDLLHLIGGKLIARTGEIPDKLDLVKSAADARFGQTFETVRFGFFVSAA